MKILLFTKYSNKGASSRLRMLQYTPFLENKGIEFTVSTLLDDFYLESLYFKKNRSYLRIFWQYLKRFFMLLVAWRFDIVWIEKELFSGSPATFERLLRFFNVRFVVDYDDAVFHNYDMSKSRLLRIFLPHKIDVVMRSSSIVVAGNNYLAKRAINAGAKDVIIIPTVIDLERYKTNSSEQNTRPVIGWIGSPSTQKYVIEIAEVLETVCQKYGATLLLVGANKNISNYFSNIDIEIAEWTETNEVNLINQFDIGIMPLPDGPWELGKCGYKLIQYMACSKPVVASPVGVNVEIVDKNNCGYLAACSHEWQSALSLLLSSYDKRIEFGSAGRRAVEKEYCVQIQVERLAKLFVTTSKVVNI